MGVLNYAKGKAVGNNSVPFYDSPPPVRAIQRYYSENAIASSVITLSPNTTAIEIGAVNSAVVMRWVAVGDTGASVVGSVLATLNYDHAIGKDTVQRFVVPVETMNTAEGVGSMVGANIANGLYRRVAYKTQAVGSILVAEYGSSNSY